MSLNLTEQASASDLIIIKNLLKNYILYQHKIDYYANLSNIYLQEYTQANKNLEKFQWQHEQELLHYYKILAHNQTVKNLNTKGVNLNPVNNPAITPIVTHEFLQNVNSNFISNTNRRSTLINNFKKFVSLDYNNKLETVINKIKNYESQIKSRLQWQGHNKELQQALPQEQLKMNKIFNFIEHEKRKSEKILNSILAIISYENFKINNSRDGLLFDSDAYIITTDCINLTDEINNYEFNKTIISYGKFLLENSKTQNRGSASRQNLVIDDYISNLQNNLKNTEMSLKSKQIDFKIKSDSVKELVKKQAKLFENVRKQLKQMQSISSSNENDNKAKNVEMTFKEISIEMLNFVRNSEDRELNLPGQTFSSSNFALNDKRIEDWHHKLITLYQELEELSCVKPNQSPSQMDPILAKPSARSSLPVEHTAPAGLVKMPEEKIENSSGSTNGVKSQTKAKINNMANQQARKVLDRIENKLNTLDGIRTVEKLVAEAMDLENLSKLYEGWTSWV